MGANFNLNVGIILFSKEIDCCWSQQQRPIQFLILIRSLEAVIAL
jgi:hypothetical protein